MAKKFQPLKFTPDQVIAALRETNGMVYLAAALLRCGPRTVYRMRDRFPAVAEAIDEERGKFIDICESALRRNVLDGKEVSIIFALKCLAKQRGYIDRMQLEVGNVGDFGYDFEGGIPTPLEIADRMKPLVAAAKPTGKSKNGASKNGNGHASNGNGKGK